jgi:putative acyl-CoA dehydrogenase
MNAHLPQDWQHAATAAAAAETHAVVNVGRELADFDMYGGDRALLEAVRREGAGWAEDSLAAFGRLTGSAEVLELGQLANQNPPQLDTHDRFGQRIDLVRFHPAYHALMRQAIAHGLHSSPWTEPREGAHVARAARFYLQTQVEAGHGCPVTMTFAAVPALRTTPALADAWLPRITARHYDPRNVPDGGKAGLTIGMAMTEKQGGSDVRANTTRAHPVGAARGPGAAYELVGHKYFVSAPMCDAFLVLAQAPAGLSCFMLPRWRPDGSRNPLQLLRLKRKMGNVSNASSETELRGALAWMVGEEGRGVRTIIEMVAMTRFDCMVGSAAGQRAAVTLALHHCGIRQAFGRPLDQQPLMRNVLADLVLEHEGSLALTMRLARAMDHRAADPHEDALVRLVTAVGKYWICKRTPQHAYEAMECIGGSGVMEDGPFARLYREAPVNAIWEGSGNVQCLDVLRAMHKSPEVVEALHAELGKARGADRRLDHWLQSLAGELHDAEQLEYRARSLVDRMALALQAALLVQHAPTAVADAFCGSRLEGSGPRQYGTLPRGVDDAAILERARPASTGV